MEAPTSSTFYRTCYLYIGTRRERAGGNTLVEGLDQYQTMTTTHIDRSGLRIPKPKTFVYDSKHDIKLDAYIPQLGSASGEMIKEHSQEMQIEMKGEKGLKKMPAVVQFHMGGMVDGSRVMVFPANLPGELPTRFFFILPPAFEGRERYEADQALLA